MIRSTFDTMNILISLARYYLPLGHIDFSSFVLCLCFVSSVYIAYLQVLSFCVLYISFVRGRQRLELEAVPPALTMRTCSNSYGNLMVARGREPAVDPARHFVANLQPAGLVHLGVWPPRDAKSLLVYTMLVVLFYSAVHSTATASLHCLYPNAGFILPVALSQQQFDDLCQYAHACTLKTILAVFLGVTFCFSEPFLVRFVNTVDFIIISLTRFVRALYRRNVIHLQSNEQFSHFDLSVSKTKKKNKNKNCDVPIAQVEQQPLSKKDKARRFHQSAVSQTPEQKYASFRSDVDRFRSVLMRGISPDFLEKTMVIKPKALMSTVAFAHNLYSWLRKAKVGDIQSLLTTALNIDQGGSQGDFYHTELRRDVKQARCTWFTTGAAMIEAVAIIMAIFPMHVPTIFQHDTDYEMPEEYSYYTNVHYGLKSGDLGKHAMQMSFGESNFLMQLFDHKILKISQSRIKGMIKSGVQQQFNLHEILELFDNQFPRMERCLKFDAKKQRIQRLVDKPLWFVNFFPKEYFFMHHSGGAQSLWDFYVARVHSLRSQLETYVRKYYDIGQMSSSERREYFEAQARSFARIMGTPEYQSMFLSGVPHDEICEFIYAQEQHTIAAQTNKQGLVAARFDNRSKRRDNHIKKARDYKYEQELFIPESNPQVDWLYAITCCLAFAGVAITSAYSWLRTMFTLEQRANTVADVVERTISSWSLSNLITNPSAENKIFLLEIKSAIHLLIEVYCGTTYGIASWGSNFCITRSEKIINVFTTIAAYLQPEHNDGEVELQSDPATDVFANIASLLSKNSLGKFSSEDLRRANAEFTYIAHARREAVDKAKFIQSFISVVCKLLFSFDPFDGGFQNFSYQLLECIQYTEKWTLKTPSTNEELQEIVDNYARYKNLPVDPLMQQIPTYLKSAFMAKMNKLEALASEANNVLVGDVRRIEPVTLLVVGKPGSGKTTALNFIKKAIAKKFNNGVVENFTMNLAGEYFEGYRNQMFVTMDDVFISTDVKERTMEARNVINMTNSTPYNLNMAFGEKGKKFFNSHYILMSSNSILPGDNVQAGLSDPEAFLRRCHIRVVRDDPYTGDMTTNTYRVTECVHYPEYVGRELNAGQLANLMIKCRELNCRRFAEFGNAELMADLDDEAFQLQSRPNLSQLPVFSSIDYIKLFVKTMADNHLKWWEDSWVPYIVSAFLLLTTVGIITYLWSGFGAFSEQSHDTRTKTRNPQATHNKQRRNQVLEYEGKRSRFSMQNDVQIDPLANISRCVVKFHASYLVGMSHFTNSCIGHHLKDSMFVFPAHFFDNLVGYEVNTLTIETHVGVFEVDFDEDKAIFVNNKDIVFYKFVLPQKVPELYKYLLSDDDEAVMPNLGERCIYTLVSRNKGVQTLIATSATYSKSVSYDTKERRYWIDHPIAYSAETTAGHSGSLLLFCDAKGKYHAIGMHVGKMSWPTYLAIAIPMSKDFVDCTIGRDNFVAQNAEFPFEITRVIDKGVPVHSKSRIVRSPLYGYRGAPTCIPAKMAPFKSDDGTIIDPSMKGILKLHQTPTPESEVPEDVFDYLFQLYPRNERYSVILTNQQMLSGIPELNLAPIDATTSPGYPYCLTATKGKAPYVVTINGEHQYGNGMEELIERYDEKLRSGEQIEVIWPDTLKDETRPIKKVKEGKTRVFVPSPLHFTLLVRKYFGGFIAYLQSKCATHPISIGINPHSAQWSVLYDRFTRYAEENWHIIAGDFENYDGRFPTFIGRAFVRFVNMWYNDGDVNAGVRYLLFHHMSNALRLHGNILYQVADGNPSGSSLTGQYNSGGQLIMDYIVFTRDLGLKVGEFDLVIYGDDNVFYLKDKGGKRLTAEDLAPHFMRRFGMTYTHWSKDQSISPVDNIHTISYLGRKFVPEGRNVLAPLDLRTIVESAYWSKKALEQSPELSLEHLVNVVGNIAMELSHHTPEVFNAERDAILAAIKERCSPIAFELCQRAMMGRLLYHQKHYSLFSDW